MKKSMFAIACAAAACLMMGLAPKPPTRVTGGVHFHWNGQRMAAAFNAHAPKGRQAAKGVLNLRRFDAQGNVKGCAIKVTNVTLSGKTATFCGQVTASADAAERGRWVKVCVVDGGTPGRTGDRIGLKWAADPRTARTAERLPLSNITAGNLTVH